MSPLSYLLCLCCLVYSVQSAKLFDAFSSSVGNLFGKHEEAPFKLLSEGQGFDEREYGSLKWVCFKASAIENSSTKQQSDTFLTLFSYLSKENSEGVEIDMTIPVSIHYKKDATTPSAQLSACFYIGGSYQANPPTPLNADLTIIETPPMTVYTRKVDGIINKPSEWLKEAEELQSTVNKAGKSFRTDEMFWNAFDAPFKLWNRRNEVWLVKV